MKLDRKFLATLLGVGESDIVAINGMTFELDSAATEQPTFQSLLNDRLRKRAEALSTALTGEDDLGKVIRGHIHIEHELHDFIFFAAPCSEQLKRFDEMEFSEKVRLALVLGLKSDLKASLNAVGNLRNKFSHRLDMKLGEDEAKNLNTTLAPAARERFQGLYRDAVSELPTLSGEARRLFEVQSQTMVFFITLFSEVAEERNRSAFEKLRSLAWH